MNFVNDIVLPNKYLSIYLFYQQWHSPRSWNTKRDLVRLITHSKIGYNKQHEPFAHFGYYNNTNSIHILNNLCITYLKFIQQIIDSLPTENLWGTINPILFCTQLVLDSPATTRSTSKFITRLVQYWNSGNSQIPYTKLWSSIQLSILSVLKKVIAKSQKANGCVYTPETTEFKI